MRNGEDSAFWARTKKGKGKDSSNPSSSDDKKRKKKIKCFYCNKSRHKQNECRKKLADEKYGVKRESGNSAHEVPIELFVALEEICTKAVQVLADDSWIIDSGASRHMTSRKD